MVASVTFADPASGRLKRRHDVLAPRLRRCNTSGRCCENSTTSGNSQTQAEP